MAGGHKLWLKCVVLYTAAGCVSATFVGVALGAIGRLLGGNPAGGPAFYLISVLSLVLAAKDLGWVKFCLPERKCQTEKVWAHEFGFVMASAMWGLHIGFGFGTRITYGGFWVLVALALGLGDPVYGGVLMLVYWLGRSLPVWVAPRLLESVSDVMELPRAILADDSLYHRLAGGVSVWSAGIALLFALRVPVPWSLNISSLFSP